MHWKSSDEGIATVEEYSGMIEAKNYGACTVTGRDESGHQVSVGVQVYDPCTIHKFEFGDTADKKTHTINLKSAVNDRWVSVTTEANGYAGERPVKFIINHPEVAELEKSQNSDNKIFVTAKKESSGIEVYEVLPKSLWKQALCTQCKTNKRKREADLCQPKC